MRRRPMSRDLPVANISIDKLRPIALAVRSSGLATARIWTDLTLILVKAAAIGFDVFRAVMSS